jgi:hypothetical protein
MPSDPFGLRAHLSRTPEGESLEERARLESASAGASSLRGGTAAFLYMDDADQGGQPVLKRPRPTERHFRLFPTERPPGHEGTPIDVERAVNGRC